MMRRRKGFSIVELLVVMTIIGILVRIAMPRYGYIRKQALSRAAIADVRVIRDASLNYHQDRGGWPTETGPGQTPPGLAQYLPQGFQFDRGTYEIDFESWPGSSPSGGPGGGGTLIGVAINTTDPELAAELRKLGASGLPYFVSGTKTTFVLDGLANIS